MRHEARTGATDNSPLAANRTSLTQHRVKEAIGNTPDVRSDRVEAVREKIESGQFKIDAQRLAGRMLTEALRDDLERP